MEAVEINGSEYVIEVWDDQVEFGEEFNFATSDFCVYLEFPRDSDEILLSTCEDNTPVPALRCPATSSMARRCFAGLFRAGSGWHPRIPLVSTFTSQR